jgi:hypothetical protein
MTTNPRGSANAESLPAIRHQPELRALLLLDTLPAGCITYLVPDSSFAPHLREGEFAVVDTADVEPVPGEFFVIAYGDDRVSAGYRFDLVEPICRKVNYCQANAAGSRAYWTDRAGEGEPRACWHVLHEASAHVRAARAMGLRPNRLTEGPFTTEHLRSKLIGRVVGIYQAQPGGPATARSKEESGQ